MLNPDMVNIGVKTLVNRLVKDFPEICTVVTEKRSDCLKFDIILIIMINIVNNVVKDTVTGRVTRSIHDHLELT